MRQPLIIRLNETKVDDRPDDLHHIYLTKETTDAPQNLVLLTKSTLKPNKIFDWHKHEDFDELFIVIDGEGTISFEGGKERTFHVGDMVNCPCGIAHKIENTSNKDLVFYFLRVKS